MFQEKSFLKLFLLSFLFTLLTVLSFPAAVTAAQLTLSWSDNSTNEDGFRIERRTGTTGTYAEIAALGVNAASYTDVNLANGTTYCYRVRAYNAGEASGYSNEQCATTSVATSYALTVAKSGTGGGVVTATGINCGADCSELYASGTSVTLTAIPAGGSSFAGWSGTGCSTTGTVTVNGNMTCTATFNINSFTLTVAKSGTGGGVVTATGINCGTDCSELYASGTSVMLTTIPAGGSSFAGWSGTGWSGSGCQGTADCTMTISSNTTITAMFVNNQADKVGIYRPSTGEWFLDQNGNGTWDGCSADKCVDSFTTGGALPVVGKWNGSGGIRLGLFFPATAQWRLDINSDEILGDCGVDRCLGPFGEATDIPVAGKWSSAGYDRIGIFRPSNERWYLDVNGNGSLNSCSKDRCASLSVYREGDLPVTGDWNGDGVTQVGLYRPSTGQWFLDRNGDRSWDGCRRDLCISSFGTAEDLPVTGDWNGTGRSKVGLFRPRTGEWLLDLNGNNQWDGCDIDLCLKDFGDVGDIPVAGKW
jgi:Divergent InlB B-repeat domain